MAVANPLVLILEPSQNMKATLSSQVMGIQTAISQAYLGRVNIHIDKLIRASEPTSTKICHGRNHEEFLVSEIRLYCSTLVDSNSNYSFLTLQIKTDSECLPPIEICIKRNCLIGALFKRKCSKGYNFSEGIRYCQPHRYFCYWKFNFMGYHSSIPTIFKPFPYCFLTIQIKT